MIVIPRTKDESIVIGDSIVVTVLEILGDEAQLCIEHPPDVPVRMREVFDAIRGTEELSVVAR
jgi:carbon storage regulator